MRRHLTAAAVIVAGVGLTAAQEKSGLAEAEAIGRAWLAVARARTSEAVTAADEALRLNPRSHDAVAVRIAALASSQPMSALDTYESWMSRTSTEDIFLLHPIARGVLTQIADTGDSSLRLTALERLARAGSPSARARLQELRKTTPSAAAALARQGDRAAAATIIEAAKGGTMRPDVAAEALGAAGPEAIPILREMLKNPAPPVRAEAIRSLAALGASDAIPELRKALSDPHPVVNSAAAVALTRLGDQEGEDRATKMLESGIPDVQLMAAGAFATRGDGPWVTAIMPLLQDPNGLTRFTAAELIAPIRPEAAAEVAIKALADQNPNVRSHAAGLFAIPALAALAKQEIPRLRALLRDPDPAVRLEGAGLLADLAGAPY